MNGKLILATGEVFPGKLLAPCSATVGEVVFNTGMTGYQEVLTDSSYCGQVVVMTYPLIGNYGICDDNSESRVPRVQGFVVGELCPDPSNWQNQRSIGTFLRENSIPCLYDVDTRAVTQVIRSAGAIKGLICSAAMNTAEALTALAEYGDRHDHVQVVTTKQVYRWSQNGPRVVVLDLGVKRNILRQLYQLGCDITVVPAFTQAADIMAFRPDGVFLSNGPGNPKDIPLVVATVRELAGKIPICGICLGHQIIALALGGDTYKMKFGHRGCNHPVKDLRSGRVYITSQNHGYAVAEESLANTGLVVTMRALHDNTVEGMAHQTWPLFSVQYHPEAAPGPGDNIYLLERFVRLLPGNALPGGEIHAATA